MKIKPITLEIEDILWNEFKEITPRTITLNEALVGLIKKEVDINGQKQHDYSDVTKDGKGENIKAE